MNILSILNCLYTKNFTGVTQKQTKVETARKQNEQQNYTSEFFMYNSIKIIIYYFYLIIFV